MKIEIHPAAERGAGDFGWLHAKYSFSFANYYNPKRTGFGNLLVLNEDMIDPGEGFEEHSHDNMEIVTIILDGVLEHKDSNGNIALIKKGDVQRMSAGNGVSHSEYNHSDKEKVHLLQIWIHPDVTGIAPEYEQKSFNLNERNKLVNIVSSEKINDSLGIHQDARLYYGSFEKNKKIQYKLKDSRYGAFLFLINGKLDIAGNVINSGDAAAITDASQIEIIARDKSEFLIVDVLLVVRRGMHK